MSTDENASFIAMPPPGASPSGRPAEEPPAPEVDENDFISLPPGIALDSGTFKTPARTSAKREPTPEITVAVGHPVPAPVTAPVATPVVTPAVPAAPVWRIVLPGAGGTIAVAASTLVGRNPAASADWPGAALVAVDDLTTSVSKTHALLEIDGGALWVHDLDSTNGVYVVVGEDATEVVPGARSAVPAGAELELGEFVLRVELSQV